MKNKKTETGKVLKRSRSRSAMRLAAAGLSAAMIFGTVFSGGLFGTGSAVRASNSQGQNGQGNSNAPGQNGQQTKPSDFKLDVECGYNGTVVPDAYMPVEVTVTNTGKDFVGSVQIIVPGKEGAQNIMYQKELALSSGSSKKVTLYVLANSPTYKINVRIVNSKNKQLHSELVRYSSIGAALNCNVGLLTDDIGALSYVDGQYLYPNDGYKTAISELTVSNFPSDWRGLDLLDVILISNFSTDQLSKEQIAALTYWVERGGLLIIGTGSTGSKTLSGLDSLVSYEGIGPVRQVTTSFDLAPLMGGTDSEIQNVLNSSSYGGGYSGGGSFTSGTAGISVNELREYYSFPVGISVTDLGYHGNYTFRIPDEMGRDLFDSDQNQMDYDYIDEDYYNDLWNSFFETETESEEEQSSEENSEPGNPDPEEPESGEEGSGNGSSSGDPNGTSAGTHYDGVTLTLDSSSVYQADFNDEVLASMVYDLKAINEYNSMSFRGGDYNYLYSVLRAAASGAKITIDPKQKNKLLDLLEANHSFGMRELVKRYFADKADVNITDLYGTADTTLYGDSWEGDRYVGDYTMVLANEMGSGMVAMVPFDFTQTPLPGHELSGPMIVSVIQRLIGDKLTDYLNDVIQKSSGSYYGGYSSLTSEERRLVTLVDNLKGAGSPAVLLIALLLLLYTIMLPIVYSVYKKKKKIVKVWVALPVLGVIFTILIYLVCIPARMNKMTLSEAKILDITSGVDTERIAAAAVMPRIKKYRVSWNGSYDVSLLSRENYLQQIFGGGNYDYDSYKIGILDGADHIGYEMVSQSIFESTDYLLQRKGECGEFGNKSTYDVFTGKDLGGTLTNNTDRDLTNAFILLNDRVYYIGDWKIGQTIQLDTLKSDGLARYSWSAVQGQISQAEAIRNILDRHGIKTITGFLFGSNGKAYKDDQAKRALVEYAFSRYSRTSYTAAVVGVSTSDESYGQLEGEKNGKDRWKEYGQTLVYSEIPTNPDTFGGIRNVKPTSIPQTVSGNGWIQTTFESDPNYTFIEVYDVPSVTLTYLVSSSDTKAFFVTDLETVIGPLDEDYYYYAYQEFSGSIRVLNHQTGDYDTFLPNEKIPLGSESPYVENGLMTVTFDISNSSYTTSVLPELFTEKEGDANADN